MGSVGRLEENMRVCHIISGITLGLVALLQGAPQTNFGNNNSKNQEEQQGSGPDETVDKKILFGNSNLNNILLGAAVGAGGAFLAQEFVNGQNNQDCSCGPSRRKRQINLSGKRGQSGGSGGDQKIFGLFGGGSDCDCGCSDNAAGGLFTFGRKKRQISIPSSSSSSSSGEEINNRFLNFRCLDAAITGRVQSKP